MKTSIELDSYYLKAIVRNELISLMPQEISKVLEVGCGIGKTGKAIVEKKKLR